jgi:CRISPR-associated protein Csh2
MTFDVPLFGALVTLRGGDNGDGNSQKLTGPLQFGIGRSTNKIQMINPLISSRFVGRENVKRTEQFSTFGRFYSVEYALIKIHGALNPENLGKYLEDKDVKKNYTECQSRIFQCLWNGTNELVTRSKFPQRSILYIEITYKNTIYNDLPDLVDEREELKNRTSILGISPFIFERLISMIEERKEKIAKIRVKGCPEIADDIKHLTTDIRKSAPKLVEEIVV